MFTSETNDDNIKEYQARQNKTRRDVQMKIKSIKAQLNELAEVVVKQGVEDVKDLEYIGYEFGSLIFMGVDKELKCKTRIRLNGYDFSLYQKWEDKKDLEFHIGYLKA